MCVGLLFSLLYCDQIPAALQLNDRIKIVYPRRTRTLHSHAHFVSLYAQKTTMVNVINVLSLAFSLYVFAPRRVAGDIRFCPQCPVCSFARASSYIANRLRLKSAKSTEWIFTELCSSQDFGTEVSASNFGVNRSNL